MISTVRNIREIRNLAISELSDDEIVKAAMDRLNTKAIMLVYDDADSNKWIFLSRYKKGGLSLLNALKRAWEEKFGKFKKIDEEEE
ncbi:MAG: hypothetical protein AB2L24_21785 [Mangrovibacterium sp.]